MGRDFRSLCQVEAKRLVFLITLIFASAIAVQYFELPYNIQSMFSVGKSKVTGLGTFSNPTDTNISHNNSQVSNSSEVKNDPVAEKNGRSDVSLESDMSRSDPEDEPFSKDSILISDNSLSRTISPVISPAPSPLSLSPNLTSASNEKISPTPLTSVDPEDEPFSKDSIQLPENSTADGELPLNSLSPTISPIISPSPPPWSSSPNIINAPSLNISPTPFTSLDRSASSEEKGTGSMFRKGKRSGELQNDKPVNKKDVRGAIKGPVSISDMNDLLRKSRMSSFSMKPRWSSGLDQELRNAKLQIENAPADKYHPGLYAPLFRNVSMFKRSYELMEQMLKIYVYKEGERPIFHTPVLKGIYASEGWFMKLLKANKHFITKNPRKAHLFYLPFSSRMLEETLYVPNSHTRRNLVKCLSDYIDVIAGRYKFWNRTGGADHFLVACHDWAPSETKKVMANSVRALCNSDVKEGFKFGKDVSLPETYVRSSQNPLRQLGGKPPSQRNILSFFAGNMHGYLRPILLQYWENKDPDMKIFGRMPKSKGNSNYIQHMKTSKYCLCAKGFEVNSPRVVEAIFYECVPVIISDDFVPPFFDVLNWESFSVFVSEKDIPNLKNILLSIPSRRYLEMYKRVKQVQQHFLWNVKPVKYDIFHMILHNIWYNRVFQMRPV